MTFYMTVVCPPSLYTCTRGARWSFRNMKSVNRSNMAAPVELSTREEQLVTRLLNRCDKPAYKYIHRRIKTQYGHTCVPLPQVKKWYRNFKSGMLNLADGSMITPTSHR